MNLPFRRGSGREKSKKNIYRSIHNLFYFFVANYSFGIEKYPKSVQRPSFEEVAANLVGNAKTVPVAILADGGFIKLFNSYKGPGILKELIFSPHWVMTSKL
jgi:hypothetical protein